MAVSSKWNKYGKPDCLDSNGYPYCGVARENHPTAGHKCACFKLDLTADNPRHDGHCVCDKPRHRVDVDGKFHSFWSSTTRRTKRLMLFLLTVSYMPVARIILDNFADEHDQERLQKAGYVGGTYAVRV